MANRKKPRSDAELIESEAWGVPSWKNEKGYPTAKKWKIMEPDQKKWEFLRRTKAYRNDWKRSQKPEAVTQKPTRFGSGCPFDENALATKYNMSCAVAPQKNYITLPKGFHFIRPAPNGGNIVFPNKPVPPADRYCEWYPGAKLAAYAKETHKPSPPVDWYQLRVWVEFDLAHGIDEQIDEAKTNLIAAANKVRDFMGMLKNPDDKYDPDDYAPQEVRARKKRGINKAPKKSVQEPPGISFLRILDAKNCGRTNIQIAAGLALSIGEDIDPSTVSKRYKAASQLWKIL